ncbi:MAG TPA: hypothetical protein VG102_03660 [Candidatus Paceibacterota bacterium]|jgi:predicted lipoprotein with Yx(FWY)xxD motif|nr:hypothetical protein [Candidatus Paceibacterota bacterium]
MKTSTLAWIVVILIILVGGWYIWMQSAVPAPLSTATTATSTASTSNPNAPANNLILGTDSTSTLGTYLIAYNGMTLYTFAKDKTDTSTCYAQCAATWPPYTVPDGTPLNLQAGVMGATATIQRTDGTFQVTYKGMPLYFYIGDKNSGDVNGQGFGKVWYVVKP